MNNNFLKMAGLFFLYAGYEFLTMGRRLDSVPKPPLEEKYEDAEFEEIESRVNKKDDESD